MTLIISEVGSNWLNQDDCLRSIEVSKEVGADICKFQIYSHRELYGYDGPQMSGEMPRDWVPVLARHAEKVGIEIAFSAFSPDGYRFIDPYVKRHKIASAENTDKDILETVKGLGKPVLVSTGGSSKLDLFNLITTDLVSMDITIMHCVANYPAKNINMLNLSAPKGVKVGYSCHSTEWMMPIHADVYSRYYNERPIDAVEKHFKVRSMYTPDSDHSILPDEFKKMVDALKTDNFTEQFPHSDEADFVKYTKRRYIPELGGYFRTKKPE